MRQLHLSTAFSLPAEVLKDVTAIVGRRGRGKTTTAVVMVEEAHALGRRFCVIDPTGAWWGLRSSRDGKSPGIPCVIFGGSHQQVPLEPTAGKLLAEFVADPTQPSVVLDIKSWTRGEQKRFLAEFLSTLYQRNERPLLLVIDEADQVAPQQTEDGPERIMLGAAQRLVKLGRVSGFGVVLVTQRPATLNKNVLNMAGVLITLGLTGPQDHDAVFSWMKHRADQAKGKEILGSLPGLERGTAWVWAPELDVLRKIAIRDRSTFDSSATPEDGKQVAPRALAEVDLEKLSAEIKGTIERAKENDPRELRRQLAEARAELAKAKPAKVPPPPKAVAPRPALKDAQIKRLEAAFDRLDAMNLHVLKTLQNHLAQMTSLGDHVAQRQQLVVAEAGNLRAALKAAHAPPPVTVTVHRAAEMSPATRETFVALARAGAAGRPLPSGPERGRTGQSAPLLRAGKGGPVHQRLLTA